MRVIVAHNGRLGLRLLKQENFRIYSKTEIHESLPKKAYIGFEMKKD